MDFATAVRARRMVRHFTPDPIDPAAIDRMLELARRAPSAGYTQGQAFVVVTDPERRRQVARCCDPSGHYEQAFGYDWVAEAPVQLIPCADEAAYHRRYQEPDKLGPDGREKVWPVPYWYVDAGMSAMVLLLAAVDEGLAAGYAGVPDMAGLRELLGIPDGVYPIGVIPVGHPAPDVKSPSLKRGRKPLESVVHRERW